MLASDVNLITMSPSESYDVPSNGRLVPSAFPPVKLHVSEVFIILIPIHRRNQIKAVIVILLPITLLYK